MESKTQKFDQSTEQFGALNQIKGQSVRARYCRTGSYFGIVPLELANGWLAWPAVQVNRQSVKTPDAEAIDAHRARKVADAWKRPEHIVRKAEAKAKRLAALTAGEVAK